MSFLQSLRRIFSKAPPPPSPPLQGVRLTHIKHDVDVGELAAYFKGGPPPAGTYVEPLNTFMARGRAIDCDCKMIQCVCGEARLHVEDCRWRKAITAAIGISCDDHRLEECPTCDPCTCPKEAA